MLQHAVATADDVAESLRRCGWKASELLLDPEGLRFAGDVLAVKPDVVFNLCDLGAFYCERLEPHVASVLELLQVPFTGSGSLTLALTDDKVLCKNLLQSYGIPTPPFSLAEEPTTEAVSRVGLPAICKPVDQHNSVGLGLDSVVYSETALEHRLECAHQMDGHWFLEHYVEGRELIGAFVGNGSERVVLPFEEIEFGAYYDGKPKVLTWESKWAEDSPACTDSRPTVPAQLDAGLKERLRDAVLRVADAFHLCEYGRVDFRVDQEGRVWVIDVNANPDLGRDAGFFLMARSAGFSYEGLMDTLVRSALSRSRAS